MDDKAFNELLESVREGGRIRRGERPAAREHRFPTPDVRRIRARLNLSQTQLATIVGISVDTVQNWEQQRRSPRGPALALLRVLEVEPERTIAALNR